jgi:hypothetical protein
MFGHFARVFADSIGNQFCYVLDSKSRGRLAQRLERPAYTREAAGSNPALPTN